MQVLIRAACRGTIICIYNTYVSMYVLHITSMIDRWYVHTYIHTLLYGIQFFL